MEIIAYGLMSGLELLCALLSVILIILISQRIQFVLTFFITFSALRYYSGGFHVSNFYACLILSNVTLIFITYCRENIRYILLHNPFILILLITIHLLPLQNSPKRKLSLKEKEVFSKRRNFILILLIGFVLILPYSEEVLAITWSIILNAISIILGHLRTKIYETKNISGRNF